MKVLSNHNYCEIRHSVVIHYYGITDQVRTVYPVARTAWLRREKYSGGSPARRLLLGWWAANHFLREMEL